MLVVICNMPLLFHILMIGLLNRHLVTSFNVVIDTRPRFIFHRLMSSRRQSSRVNASKKMRIEEDLKENKKEIIGIKNTEISDKKKQIVNKPEQPLNSDTSADKPVKKKQKKTKKAQAETQRFTDRDEIKKLWDGREASEKSKSYTFKILSWNVNGLRALLKNHPDALPSLAENHDVICLQETKLQEIHVTDPKLKIEEVLLGEGFDSHYHCSTVKKGYSGTAVFVKQRTSENHPKKNKKQSSLADFFNNKTHTKGESEEIISNGEEGSIGGIDVSNLIPTNVSYKIGNEDHDNEGRMISVDFPLFSITNVYVPNSGQKLERLSYRTESWDKDLLNFVKEKDKLRPAIWLGDLNVAHTNLDVWNDGAKHLSKQAGTTSEEKASFQQQLDTDEASFVDAFRLLHPDAKGQYSYWSQRAGNREPNKGMRLDYFICSKKLIDSENNRKNRKVFVRDSYILPGIFGSDHCPVVLELEIMK